MASKLLWKLVRLSRLLWIRAVLFALLAIGAALLGLTLAPFLPEDLGTDIGAESVDSILSVLSSSMLAVTTFSLSVMVQAFSGAASSVTPRAVRLLMGDRTTQNALSTFLGAFIFSLSSIILLQTGLYDTRGRVVLFAVSVIVVLLIVITMVRWIEHLRRFGRVAHTTSQVEAATASALETRAGDPALGGHPLGDASRIPATARAVSAPSTGYVQHVDIAGLQKLAERLDARIYVRALPGRFVHPAASLVSIMPADSGPLADADAELQQAFTIGELRGFDTDPRFGLSVLTEIAQRALSPAVNDPGTAIDVLGRHLRLLSGWAAPRPPATLRHDRVWVPPLSATDLIEDCFAPIARDGAAMNEVQLRLQKSLRALSEIAPVLYGPAVFQIAKQALRRAEAAGTLPEELERQRRAGPLSGESATD